MTNSILKAFVIDILGEEYSVKVVEKIKVLENDYVYRCEIYEKIDGKELSFKISKHAVYGVESSGSSLFSSPLLIRKWAHLVETINMRLYKEKQQGFNPVELEVEND